MFRNLKVCHPMLKLHTKPACTPSQTNLHQASLCRCLPQQASRRRRRWRSLQKDWSKSKQSWNNVSGFYDGNLSLAICPELSLAEQGYQCAECQINLTPTQARVLLLWHHLNSILLGQYESCRQNFCSSQLSNIHLLISGELYPFQFVCLFIVAQLLIIMYLHVCTFCLSDSTSKECLFTNKQKSTTTTTTPGLWLHRAILLP